MQTAAGSPDGTQLWAAEFDGGKGGVQNAPTIGTSPDGSTVFIAGDDGGTLGDYATVAYDAGSGNQLWVARYGQASTDERARALAVSPDGSTVFVTGVSCCGDPSGADYATVAYDASTGSQLWVARFNSAENGGDAAVAIVVSPNGSRVVVTGIVDDGPQRDYMTVAYSTANGNQLWATRFDAGDDVPTSLAVSPDGSKVFVTGRTDGGNFSAGSAYSTLAYDAATGTQLWEAHYDGGGSEQANAVDVSPDSSKVFVTGISYGDAAVSDAYATVAYNASTGAEIWSTRLANGGGYGAFDLAISPDGAKVFVTGTSCAPGCDYTTVAYDSSSGSQQWRTDYDNGGGDQAVAVGVSPDASTVLVTGASDGSGGFGDVDYATVAYGASSGSQLWVARYDGPAHGHANGTALAFSPDSSKTFVVGQTCGGVVPPYSCDYGTVAYATGVAPPPPSPVAVLFIQGIGSSSTCQTSPDFVGRVSWLRSALNSAVSPSRSLYYAYRSPYTTSPTCVNPSIPRYSKLDSCWSLDDVYSAPFFRGVREVPGGGQATRLAAYLKAYLDAHPGEVLAIVTHSQGGVLASYVVKEKLSSAYTSRIRAIVTLDSPLLGINSVGPAFLRAKSGCANGDKRLDSAFDMEPTSDVIRQINDPNQPLTKLFTVDADPGALCSACVFPLVDDAHSTTWWATAHIRVAAATHSDIWEGCFEEATGTICAGPKGLDLESQGRKLVRFAACAIRALAPDCTTYAND